MEASKFGFGDNFPPVFKFDPTDADLVANYLLPRAVGLPDPHPHAIIDDDTMSLPPWELLQKHGHGTSEHAFFFEPPARTRNGGRRGRTVKDGAGTWRGQKREVFSLTLLHPDGGELDLTYERYCLTFKPASKKRKANAVDWVMYEYDIISPPLPNTLLTRIKISDQSKKDVEQELLPYDEVESSGQVAVPGPSYEHYAIMAADDEQGDALLMEDMQCQQTGEIEAVVADQNVFPVQEQMSTSYDYDPAVMTSAGDVGQMGGYYTPLNADQGGVYYDGYGQYQEGFPCPDHEQHGAGDCGGGEELEGVALQPMGETNGYVHRSLDPFEAATNAEYHELDGDNEEQSNPLAGSSTAVTGASDGHGGREEMTSRPVFTSLDPFEAAANAEYEELDGDNEDQPNPLTGSSTTAVTGASEGHGGRGETSRPVLPSLDPFEAAGGYYDDDYS